MNPKHPIKFKWRQRPHYHPIPFGKDIDEFVPEPAPPEPEPPKPKPNPEPADDDLTRKIGRQLLPLVQSHTYNTREEELKRISIRLFIEQLSGSFNDVNVYGAPHLGSRVLLRQYLVSENIANFNATSLDGDNMRYLLMAWRYLNQKRGTHFLRTFITLVWGHTFQILPYYCRKSGHYPEDCLTLPEIELSSENIDDYFLTSRLQIFLTGEIGYFPSEIGKSLNNALPARLQVQDVLRKIEGYGALYAAMAGASYSVVLGRGVA